MSRSIECEGGSVKKTSNMKRNNHYVSKFYLKNWANEENRIWRYSTLVSHEGVPEWKLCSLKSVAYKRDLYTHVTPDSESDRVGQWFEKKYESPAVTPISKAISGAQLITNDWENIVWYLAMQDLRTLARLAEYLQRMLETVPEIMNDVINDIKVQSENGTLKNDILNDIKVQLENGNLKKHDTAEEKPDEIDKFPLKLTQETKKGSKLIYIALKAVIGRRYWLWNIKHLLETTAKVLHKHKWTIMRPAKGLTWPTSDNPVIRLNYCKDGKYNFTGGWDNADSEILFPIGPEHLVYTKIGSRPPRRGTRLDVKESLLIRKLIVESAYSMVFSNQEDKDIPKIKPRTIDAHRFRANQEQWENWNSEQLDAERNF